jgi:hypothetical protein
MQYTRIFAITAVIKLPPEKKKEWHKFPHFVYTPTPPPAATATTADFDDAKWSLQWDAVILT